MFRLSAWVYEHVLPCAMHHANLVLFTFKTPRAETLRRFKSAIRYGGLSVASLDIRFFVQSSEFDMDHGSVLTVSFLAVKIVRFEK